MHASSLLFLFLSFLFFFKYVLGSIHEGGELGYCLSVAFGSVFDNPDLITTCIVGDGEAETGPLATSWNSIKVSSHLPLSFSLLLFHSVFFPSPPLFSPSLFQLGTTRG